MDADTSIHGSMAQMIILSSGIYDFVRDHRSTCGSQNIALGAVLHFTSLTSFKLQMAAAFSMLRLYTTSNGSPVAM